MRENGLEKVSNDSMERFKLSGASTGKGPAVRANTGDKPDLAAQAMMNHVRGAHNTVY